MAEKNQKKSSVKKDELFWKVLDAAIALEVRHGHLKWKMSELSRKSKVSRPLVYYYFGKDRKVILSQAIQLFGDELAGLSDRRIKYWQEGDIYHSVLASRELTQKLPHFVSFYFMHRLSENEIGVNIREIELRYAKKIKNFFPGATSDQVKALFGFFFGLTFAPGINKQAIFEGVHAIIRSFENIKGSMIKAPSSMPSS